MEGKEPLVELNRRAMEYIWNAVNPKENKDGVDYITYLKTDIPALYYSGLVDTVRYKRAEWEQAFEDCLGEDGRYWISHEKMIWLGRYRYCKVVSEPFDPLKMRTGKYQADRLWALFQKSIVPSTSLPEYFLKNVFDQIYREHKTKLELIPEEALKKLKEKGKEIEEAKVDEVIFVKEDGKEFCILEKKHLEHIRNLLDTYPSPRRKMEIKVNNVRTERLQNLADVAKNPQKSAFDAEPDFRANTKKSLKDLLVKASENPTAGRKPKDEVLDLKAMQKNRPTKF